jgi:hypothetical protein
MITCDLRDSILVAVKIGDLGAYRDGQVISYIDPIAAKTSDPKSKWDISDYPCGTMDSVAFGLIKLPRKEIETVRAMINKFSIEDAPKSLDVLNLESVEYATVISDWRAKGKETAPIEKSTLVIVTKDTAAEAVKDLNAVTSGSYTIGTGGDYDKPSTAFADKGATTAGNTLTFTLLNALTDNGAITDLVAVNGTFNYNGQNYLILSDVNAYYHQIATPTSTGTINYYNQNHKNIYMKSSIGAIIRCLSTMNFTGNLNLYNLRLDNSTTVTAIVYGLIFNVTNPISTLRNCILYGYTLANTNSHGIITNSKTTASRTMENIVLTRFYRAISNGNIVNTYKNCVLINNNSNFYLSTNSVSVNCATDKASVGAGTDTAPQVSMTSDNELINSDITDLIDGYRLKSSTSTKLKNNGATTSIWNTTDIFGKPRPGAGGYSIGVSENVAAGKPTQFISF